MKHAAKAGEEIPAAKALSGLPNTKTDIPEIRAISLASIHADYGWNARDERTIENEPPGDGEGEGEGGFRGLKRSIQSVGQRDPVFLRNTHGKTLGGEKTTIPYELMSGFRRYRAVTHLHGEGLSIPNLPTGLILAIVLRADTPLEARIINGCENVTRESLRPQDRMFLVQQLLAAGMSQDEICDKLGVSQSWVSKLCGVVTLPEPILLHWRNQIPIAPVPTPQGPLGTTPVSKELSVVELYQLSRKHKASLNPAETVAEYIQAVRREPASQATGGEPNKPADPTRDKVRDTIVRYASMVAGLVKCGLVGPVKGDWFQAIGPKGRHFPLEAERGATRERLLDLAHDAAEAYTEALRESETRIRTDDE